MFRRLRPHLTYANVIATLALFLALGGTSVAALRISSKQIVNNSVQGVDVRRNALQSSDIRNGTLGSADVRRNSLGSAAISGLRAGDFLPGQLPDPMPATLPPGRTLRGVFSAAVTGGTNDAGIARAPVSFPIPLGSAPAVAYVTENTAGPRECPGRASDPQALPGVLCMYESKAVGAIAARGPFDPITGTNFVASRFGALVFVNGGSGASVRGTWAVTAP